MSLPAEVKALPPKRQALAKALADPNVKTVTAAAIQAGVHRSTATRGRQNAAVTSAVEALQRSRADKARAILEKSQDRLLSLLERDESGEFALRAYIASAQVIDKLGETQQDKGLLAELGRSAMRRRTLRALRFATRYPGALERYIRLLSGPQRAKDDQSPTVVTVEKAKV